MQWRLNKFIYLETPNKYQSTQKNLGFVINIKKNSFIIDG
jgi:hypothetical protein